jgi:uncharacterized protein involved in response to NO
MGAMASDEKSGAFSGAFFSYGFRPFFLAVGCYAPIAIVYWLGVLTGWWRAPVGVSPIWWHGHEMVFGWALAAVSGFLLTAVPSWTSTRPVAGAALAFLWLLWLLGRAGMWFSTSLPGGVGAALDLLLIPGLLWFVAPPIYRSGQRRNYGFPVFLVLLWVADLLSLLPYTSAWPGRTTTGLYLGTYVMIVMLTIIGGRVVPNFTSNALRAQNLEQDVKTGDVFSKAAIAGVIVALAIDLAVRTRPSAALLGLVNGWAALLATLLLILRARGWRFQETWSNSLLWVLHVGQGWLIVAFAARAISSLTGWIPPTIAFHAMGAGAMATMIIAFATRASLGHTGRPLQASRVTTLVYLLVIAAGVARVAAPLLSASLQRSGLVVAGGLFAVAYVIYVFEYFPILTRPRVR